jgi:hypothetical protein
LACLNYQGEDKIRAAKLRQDIKGEDKTSRK